MHRVDGFLCDGFAGGVAFANLVHRDKPLVGQHGFHHLAGTGADGHHVFVGHGFFEEALFFEVLQHRLAAVVTVQAAVGCWAVVVDLGIQREDGDQRQAVALRTSVVVEVVRAGDLDAAAAECLVHKVVRNDGNLAVAQRQVDHLADQVFVTLVVRVHTQRAVGQHGLRPCGGDVHAAHGRAVGGGLWTVAEGVFDVPHEAIALFVFHLQIRHCAL